MSIDYQNDASIQAIARENPELWRFFEGIEPYHPTPPVSMDDPAFRDALLIARFMRISATRKFTCEPGHMHTGYSREGRDHNGEDYIDIQSHLVTRIDEATYNALRNQKQTTSNTESELYAMHNFFYLHEDLLADDFLILKDSYTHMEIVTRLKTIDGFYHFVFSRC